MIYLTPMVNQMPVEAQVIQNIKQHGIYIVGLEIGNAH